MCLSSLLMSLSRGSSVHLNVCPVLVCTASRSVRLALTLCVCACVLLHRCCYCFCCYYCCYCWLSCPSRSPKIHCPFVHPDPDSPWTRQTQTRCGQKPKYRDQNLTIVSHIFIFLTLSLDRFDHGVQSTLLRPSFASFFCFFLGLFCPHSHSL